jgi:hypothetical protein
VDQYNPFPYQPMMRYYYNGGVDPQRIAQFAQQNPALAAHVESVSGFIAWLAQMFPEIYRAISAQAPDLADPITAVQKIAPASTQTRNSWAGRGLAGWNADPATGINVWTDDASASGETDKPWSGVVSEWGKSVMDLAKGYLVYDTQRDVIKLNIKRAEQGLPPLPMDAFNPQVNVGLSADVQKLGMIAIGGLIIVGLISAARKR